MTAMLVLIILSVLLGGVGLAVFMWSLRAGQYDDMQGAASRVLFDEPPQGRSGPTD